MPVSIRNDEPNEKSLGSHDVSYESPPRTSPLQMQMPHRSLDAQKWETMCGTYKTMSRHHLIYSLAGLLLGLAAILGGIVLFLHGIFGATSWTAKALGAKSELSDAPAGVVLFIVGRFVVLITRYVARLTR